MYRFKTGIKECSMYRFKTGIKEGRAVALCYILQIILSNEVLKHEPSFIHDSQLKANYPD
jgi:hypothetical protein